MSTLEENEREQTDKLEALRTALLDGEASGLAEEGVFDRVLVSQGPNAGPGNAHRLASGLGSKIRRCAPLAGVGLRRPCGLLDVSWCAPLR